MYQFSLVKSMLKFWDDQIDWNMCSQLKIKSCTFIFVKTGCDKCMSEMSFNTEDKVYQKYSS